MAGLNREAIYAALATRLATINGLQVFRRLPPSPQAPHQSEQPCAFLPVDKEIPARTPRGSTIWTLSTEIVLYQRTDDQGNAPATPLTALIASIEGALQMKAGDMRIDYPSSGTTLGGLCESCHMGTVQYGEGVEDGQGIAIIPITIIAASPQ